MSEKRYLIYDGDTLIGSYTGVEAEEAFGWDRRAPGKCAYAGTKLQGRYTIRYEDGKPPSGKMTAEARERISREWDDTVTVFKEAQAVRQMLLECWDAAVGPLRKEYRGIWRNG